MDFAQTQKVLWLNRAFHADKKAKALEAKAEYDRSIAERLTRSCSGTGGTASKNSTEDALIRLAETERLLHEELQKLVQIRYEITLAISSVDDIDMQAILMLHFLAYETFEEIAEKLNYSRATIMRKYKKSLGKMILNDTLKCDKIVV